MDARNHTAEITKLFDSLLRRAPRPPELENWVARARRDNTSFEALFDQVTALEEYKTRAGVLTSHPPGHYYSPVVDSESLKGSHRVDRNQPLDRLLGLPIDDGVMLDMLATLTPHLGHHRFADAKQDGERYFTGNGFFELGDALILSGMIAHFRPAQIIEIGSGFSTACMLDAADREGLATRVTCIEPFPARLRANLTPPDAERVTIVEAMVQATDPEMYRALKAGDILFIDSTHVMKTGSDVCFELFEILPRLAPGVIVHIHDIQYPFEYPDVWIFDKKRSWNEIYAVRAFLSFNTRFKVIAFNNYLGRFHKDRLQAAYGAEVRNTGGGLWMRVEPDGTGC